ncbi:alcohol dehydrogenase catalytic domain-containing protein [Kitasatospora sp. NPDC004272]
MGPNGPFHPTTDPGDSPARHRAGTGARWRGAAHGPTRPCGQLRENGVDDGERATALRGEPGLGGGPPRTGGGDRCRPLVLERRPPPVPVRARSWCEVEVEACGVCRTDLHLAEGDLPPRLPRCTPGHEVVGRRARVPGRGRPGPAGCGAGRPARAAPGRGSGGPQVVGTEGLVVVGTVTVDVGVELG